MREPLRLGAKPDNAKPTGMVKLCTFFLAVAPIFDPYLLASFGSFSFKILDIPMLICAALLIIAGALKFSESNKDSILLMSIALLMLTIISFIDQSGNRDMMNALKNNVIELVYVLTVTMIWKGSSRKLFIEMVRKVAFLSTILLFVQYIAVNVGFTQIFDGKIPFLEIGKYDRWADLIDPNTGDIRVHSVFQEPSYYGMYILPVFAHTLQKREYKMSIFYLLGLVLSSSLVAILGAAIIFCVMFFILSEDATLVRAMKGVLMLIPIAILGVVLYTQVEFVRNTIDYAFERIGNISNDLEGDRYSSNKIRLLGYLEYFAEYPLFFKVFGVGSNQFSTYLDVYAYSNTIVSTILNYGICGILIFGTCVVSWFKKLKANRIFVVVFVLIMASDYQWINWYFFYVVSWIVLSDTYVNIKAR